MHRIGHRASYNQPIISEHFLYFTFQEKLLLDPMFDVPDSEINSVCIDEEVVKGNKTPIYTTIPKDSKQNREKDLESSVDDDPEPFPKDATSSG